MKRNTKSRVSDIIVTTICICGAVLSFYLFWKDFTQVLSKLNENPIATVTWKRKAAQRKFSDRMIWDRLRQDAPIYNGDTIRTSTNAETTITMQDSVFELGSNTIIQIFVDDNGETALDFSGGVISAKTSESSGNIKLKSGNVVVDLEKGSSISASSGISGSQGIPLQFNVLDGSAVISDKNGARILQQGSAFSLSPNGEIQTNYIAVATPAPQTRLLNHTDELLPVQFTWATNNLPNNSTVVFETALDKQFVNIQDQIAISGLKSMTINCQNGILYWRFYITQNGEIIQDSITEGKLNILSAPSPSAIVPQKGDIFSYRTVLPSIRFMWEGNEYASQYLFEVADNPEINNPIISQRSPYPSSIVSSLGKGTWYWRVTPYYTMDGIGYSNPSPVENFIIDQKAKLGKPIPISPTNGSFVNIASDQNNSQTESYAPIFSWVRENDAASYTLTIASDPEMNNIITEISTTENYAEFMPPSTGRWFWKVIQIDTEGNVSESSNISSFIAMDREVIFQTVFPPNGYSVAQARIQDTKFTWKSNIPDEIKFQISTNQDFSDIYYEENLGKDILGTLGKSIPIGTYYWRIAFQEKEGVFIETQPKQLNVLPPLDKPIIVSPLQESNLVSKLQQPSNFIWQPVEGADYYQIKIYTEDGISLENKEPVFEDLYVEKTSKSFVFDSLPPGKYIWTVQAFAEESAINSRRTGLLSEQKFTLQKIYPVQLENPSNNSTFEGIDAFLHPSKITYLSRTSISAAELVVVKGNTNALPKQYGQAASNVAGSTIVYREKIDSLTPKLPSLSNGTYWYTINALAISGHDISSITPFKFTVNPISPFPAPKTISPANNQVFDETYLLEELTITLSWEQVQQADAYELVIKNLDTQETVLKTYIAAPSDKKRNINRTLDLTQFGVGNFQWFVSAKRYMPGNEGQRFEDRVILQDGIASENIFQVYLPQEEIYIYDPGDLYGN
ncbi:MAG: hypothetical protein E7063_06210 [Spirochaetaceae bacterium]|nr:hypothetical protein [Spirochaetaceae bacterium]